MCVCAHISYILSHIGDNGEEVRKLLLVVRMIIPRIVKRQLLKTTEHGMDHGFS